MSAASVSGLSGLRRHEVSAWSLAVVAFAAPVVALAAPMGVAPLAIVAGLVALICRWPDRPWLGAPRLPVAVAAGATLWGLASALWSINPGLAVRTALSFGGMAVAGLALVSAASALDERGRRRVGVALVAGFLIVLAVVVVEIATGGKTFVRLRFHSEDFDGPGRFVLNRLATAMAVLVWPAVWHLRTLGGRRLGWGVAAGVTTVLAAALAKLASLAAVVGLAGGIAVALLVAARGRAVVRLAGAGMAVLLLAAPVLAWQIPDPRVVWEHLGDEARLSLHHRVTIWHFAGQRIAEHPLRGWGMESARDIPGGQETLHVSSRRPDGSVLSLTETLLPLHTHNFALHWWLELGLPGGLLLGAAVWAGAGAAGRARSRAGMGLACGLLVAAVAIGAVSYSAWASWWLGMQWLAAAFCVAADRQAGQEA